MNSSLIFTFPLLAMLGGLAMPARAALRTQVIDYKDGDVALQGYLAWDDSRTGPTPGVLVIHEWWGHVEYNRKRAEQIAGLGYVAFSLDMYGKGVKTDNAQDAAKLATPFYKDRGLMRSRATAGLNVLKQQKNVDPKRIAAIGYCFGGTTALDLARGGADLAAVVSFHGGLQFENPDETRNIKGKVLICSGADDPMVPPEQVDAFEALLRSAKVDYQINIYGGAVHGFTNPGADARNIPGIKYNEKADKRSWEAMRAWFAETLGS